MAPEKRICSKKNCTRVTRGEYKTCYDCRVTAQRQSRVGTAVNPDPNPFKELTGYSKRERNKCPQK